MTGRMVAAQILLRERVTRELREAQDRALEQTLRTPSGGFRFDLTRPDLEEDDAPNRR